MSPPVSGGAPVLVIVHHHPGRLRLRSEALRDGDALAGRATGVLAASEGVLCVEHHPGTGSLLIEYDPARVSADALLERAAQASGLRAGREPPRRPERTHGERFVQTCREMNDAAWEAMGFRMEPRTLVPVGMAALAGAFFFLNRGQRMPRWDNLAYWSISLFAMLHGREMGAPAAAPGAEPAGAGPAGERAPR